MQGPYRMKLGVARWLAMNYITTAPLLCQVFERPGGGTGQIPLLFPGLSKSIGSRS